MKNLYIVGDSLACPRPWEGVEQNQTYAALLQREFAGLVHVVNLAYSDRCTSDYVTDSFIKTYVKGGGASYVVIQLGIVDCAPRLLTSVERAFGFLCRKSNSTSSIFMRYVKWKSNHRMFFTKWFPMTKVDLSNYKSNIRSIINEYVKYNTIDKFVLINIAYPGDSLLSKSWGILENIVKYNHALDEIAAEMPQLVLVANIFEKTRNNPSWVTNEDGHHILPDAHRWLVSEIIRLISERESR